MSSINEILKKYYKKIDNLDLELLIARAIKKPREFVIAHPEYKLSKNYELRIKNYADRRMSNEPLAYILGQKEFYGLDFKVNKNVLIPRPETEMMVDEALNHITRNMEHITFIDIGAGSGCIIVALAKKISNNELRIMNYEFIGIDISKAALKVAHQNAKIHKVSQKIKFLHSNLLESIKSKIDNRKSQIVILANLPYLTHVQIKNSSSIQHEPKIALNAGRDGLKYYRRLFRQIKKIKKLYVACYVLCETDPSQTLKMRKIIKSQFPKSKITIKKDLCGLNRLVMIKI